MQKNLQNDINTTTLRKFYTKIEKNIKRTVATLENKNIQKS